MRRVTTIALIAMLLLPLTLAPGVASAGSSTDAALGLGAFAALGTLLLGAAALGHPAVVAPAPVVVAPPAPPVVYAPAPPVVYAPAPPPVVYEYGDRHRHGRDHHMRRYAYEHRNWRRF